MFTAKRSTLNPRFFIIYKPDGRAWRTCHQDRIEARLAELNGDG